MRLTADDHGRPDPPNPPDPLLPPNCCKNVAVALFSPNWDRPNPKRANPDPIQIPKSSIIVMMRNVTNEMYGSAIP